MKLLQFACVFLAVGFLNASHAQQKKKTSKQSEFNHVVEEFADIKVLRYQVPGFEKLTLKEQKLVY